MQDGNLGKKQSEKLRKIMKDIFDPWGPYVPMWNTVFAILSVVAVSIDPLFLYIPVLDENKKCLSVDQELKFIALTFRSAIDVSYTMHTIFQIRATFMAEASGASKRSGLVLSNTYWKTARRIRWSNILIDILAILPLPQVLISLYFPKVWRFRSLATSKVINFLLLIQYVPRVLRIYLSCEKVKRTPGGHSRTACFNGALNVSLYIVASHVFGAVWYFFAIQRETACWHFACEKHTGCLFESFDCHSNDSTDLTLIVSGFCPTSPPEVKTFDYYGIYSDAVQSGVFKKTTSFLQKFVRCFWWGLRNVSSFGQNLQTSTSVWETCFAALISIIALLLFIYLIGNLQMYFQMATTRSEEILQRMRRIEAEIDIWVNSHSLPANEKTLILQQVQHALEHDKDSLDLALLRSLLVDRIECIQGNSNEDGIEKLEDGREPEERMKLGKMIKEQKAEHWMSRNVIPENIKRAIMPYVRSKLQDNADVDLNTLLSILPRELKMSVKKHLCFAVLKRVPMLQDLDDNVVEIICDYLKPVIYPENSYIIQQGEPLDLMFFITEGVAWTYAASNCGEISISTSSSLEKGDFYGDKELLAWSLNCTSLSNIPISTTNVKAHTKVEALALMAKDLRNLVSTSTGSSSSPNRIRIKLELIKENSDANHSNIV